MSRDSSEERSNAPKCTFEVHRSEGDSLYLKKKYTKAIECYSKALKMKGDDIHCLLRRSCCYEFIGDCDKALEDSNAALNVSPDNYKGLFQKAQVLYNRGEFEFALVFFHRGHKKRPELQQFRLGIQKCEEAIRNSLEDTKAWRVTKEGSQAFTSQMHEQEEKQKKPQKRPTGKTTKKSEKDKQQNDRPLHILPPSKSRVIFGYLYDDHEYLKKLMQQEDLLAQKREKSTVWRNLKASGISIRGMQKWRTACSEEVKQIAKNGLDYLDVRSQFWHQEKPIYARGRSKATAKSATGKSKDQSKCKIEQGMTIYQVLERLHEIDQYQRNSEHQIAARMARDLRHEVEQWSDDKCPNRLEVLANVNSMLGLSHLELSQYEEALEAHKKAYTMGQQCDLPEIVAHAIDNIGRVHAKKGEYQAAINIWEKKLESSIDKYELVWLQYEIGRCYLELGNAEKALENGKHALTLALELEDEPWQLNINVLLGQANLQLRKRLDAQTAFTKAHDLAKVLGAGDAERAIMEVMDEFQNTECEFDSETLTFEEENPELIQPKAHVLHFQRTRSPISA